MITEQTVIEELKNANALLHGHFILSSGRHSDSYCQCAQLLRFPKKAELVLSRVSDQVKESGIKITKVCGPAMGAILVAYELGRLLDKEAIFTERNKETDKMELRRGFSVGEGDTILLTEDAITTGKSTLETIEVLEAMGAKVVALACIADRRGSTVYDLHGLPLFSAVRLSFDSFDPAECPLCKEGKIPAIKPGSRKN